MNTEHAHITMTYVRHTSRGPAKPVYRMECAKCGEVEEEIVHHGPWKDRHANCGGKHDS